MEFQPLCKCKVNEKRLKGQALDLVLPAGFPQCLTILVLAASPAFNSFFKSCQAQMGRKFLKFYSFINNLFLMFILKPCLSSQSPSCCLCGDRRHPILFCALPENQISSFPWHILPHILALGSRWSLIYVAWTSSYH